MTNSSFDRAQAQYDAQTPPYDAFTPFDLEDGREVWDDNADCKCEPDQGDDGQPILYRKNCQRHSEPPCERCGWQAVCPDCVGT